MMARPGAVGAFFTDADDNGDGEEGMELSGWGGAADDNDKVSLSMMVWMFGLRNVVSGVWCVVNGTRAQSLPLDTSTYLEYLPTTYVDRYRDDVLYLLSTYASD